MATIGFLLILIAGVIVTSIIAVRWKRATPWDTLLELGLIGLWAMWVGREYLNLDPRLWPSIGVYSRTINEFGSAIQPHFVWSLLPKCGLCLFWNGSINGGAPTFADLYGATLHPIVFITTLLLGAINGAKITLIASLALAGAAQWWLARAMGLGRVARLWSATMAVVGGHLAGRMEIGIVTLVLATAACSLIIAPGIDLALTGRRRAAILFGLALSLALLSGQGYVQIGMLIGLLPAFAIFLFDRRLRLKRLWKEFALAGLIAWLVSAVLWVPVLHFWPNVTKGVDPTFATAQPIEQAALNLVIDDPSFYTTGQLSSPHLYINYLGWIPIAFALLAIATTARSDRRLLAFFLIAIALIYLAASAITLKGLALVLPDLIATVRYPALIAGLAVPLILGLAAWGLDRLLRSNWLMRVMTLTVGRIAVSIGLGILLIGALRSAYVFGQNWLMTSYAPPAADQVIDMIDRSSPQWIGVPFGEHVWTAIGLSADLKLTNAFRPWNWKDRAMPPAFFEVAYKPTATSVANRFGTTEGIEVISHPDHAYAQIDTGALHVPCRASARGGDIDVDCSSDADGTLTVYENSWTGWLANQDDAPIELSAGQWLSVAAPSGQHHYEFRYRPWDVPVGLMLSAVGLGLCIILWRRSARTIAHR